MKDLPLCGGELVYFHQRNRHKEGGLMSFLARLHRRDWRREQVGPCEEKAASCLFSTGPSSTPLIALSASANAPSQRDVPSRASCLSLTNPVVSFGRALNRRRNLRSCNIETFHLRCCHACEESRTSFLRLQRSTKSFHQAV